VLGQSIVSHLAKRQPQLISTFTLSRKELLSKKQNNTPSATDKTQIQRNTRSRRDSDLANINDCVIVNDSDADHHHFNSQDRHHNALHVVTKTLKKMAKWGKSGPYMSLSHRKSRISHTSTDSANEDGHSHSHSHGHSHGHGHDSCTGSTDQGGRSGDHDARGDGVDMPLHNSGGVVSKHHVVSREDAAEAFGTEMYGMLATAVEFLWQSDQMAEKLVVISARLYQYGLRLSHIDDLGDAIHAALRVALEFPCNECGNHEWDKEISLAWAWLWGIISKGIIKTVGTFERREHDVVRRTWEVIKTRHDSMQIGETFYQELRREAPFVLQLFHRPKKLQAYMWMQAVELLVTFSERPSEFFEELKHLTIRHIKYGVKAEYVTPFGNTLLAGLGMLLTDEWTDVKVQAAWKALWQRVSTCVSRAFNVGSNLIMVALVNGDMDKLQKAIMCAPRVERVSWVCRLSGYNSILSPIFWAIRDGRFDIAQFLIADVLSIRADRERYYYGREELHKTHPQLVSILCMECPEQIDSFLDGLMWHSQTVDDGLLRVNYYLADLYADPTQVPDPYKTPLAVLCMHGESSMFDHPVLDKLLTLKWQRFGRNMVLCNHVYLFALLAVFTAFLHENLHAEDISCSETETALIYTAGGMSLILLLGMCIMCVRQVSRGCVWRVHVAGDISVRLPMLLANGWQAMRLCMVISIVIAVATSYCNMLFPVAAKDQFRATIYPFNILIKSISALMIFLQALEALMLFDQLAAVILAAKILIQDVTANLIVITAVMVSFSAALLALEDVEYPSLAQGIWVLIKASLYMGHPAVDHVHSFASVLVTVYMICTCVLLLSMLVAQMSLAYAKVAPEKSRLAKKNRAYACVEVEALLPLSSRQKMFQELRFDSPLEFDNGDMGPAGGVQVLESASVRAHPKYCPDRIQRCTVSCLPSDPWPQIEEEPSKEHD
jgi:hemoglobin-like flavoprotein